MIFQLLIAFFIYAISFCMMENTINRIDSNGIKQFSVIPIFTEGLIGPVRTLYLSLRYHGLNAFLCNIMYLFVNLNNMFGSTFFAFYILSVLENNFMSKTIQNNYEIVSNV